ncbi:MAG: PucR family transcriptional regulator [Eubacteriales bacterium]|nr:PucR family transcriptional regulator [Eubacteriales bacterium]
MAVTVKDLLNLEVMRDFKLMAGEGGLNKPIKETEILDFEFVTDMKSTRDRIFNGESLVLTSLLFAKDNPDIILEAIKWIYEMNVSALAFKPVIFKDLPEEVINFANKKDFPILSFGRDEFFEDIIFAIKEETSRDNKLLALELLIENATNNNLTLSDDIRLKEKLNPNFKQYIRCIFIEEQGMDEFKAKEKIKKIFIPEKISRKILISKYKNMYCIILSQDEEAESRFDALLQDVLVAVEIATNEITIGISRISGEEGILNKLIKEAYWSLIVAKVENTEKINFDNIGIYKMLMPYINDVNITNYMEEYLAPLFSEEEKDGELLRTAVEYIKSKGDMVETSRRMFCHKNTIRYRIGKLQEKLDYKSTEREFYENLSMAIKIYMLKMYI